VHGTLLAPAAVHGVLCTSSQCPPGTMTVWADDLLLVAGCGTRAAAAMLQQQSSDGVMRGSAASCPCLRTMKGLEPLQEPSTAVLRAPWPGQGQGLGLITK
jgi:hypothetical protein